MVEVDKKIISDIGGGNFGDGVRALKEAGVYVYEPHKELGKYYFSAELSIREMREFEVHDVLPGWRFLLAGNYEDMGAVLLVDIIAAKIGEYILNRPALKDVILENADYFRLEDIAEDAERACSIKEENGSWYEQED